MAISVRFGRRVSPRRILLYGVHGIGKSTFAGMAPKAVFIPTEDGLDDIDCASFDLCRSYADVLDCLGQLYAEEHDFRTLVIDSVDWLERLIWQEVCRQRQVDSIEDIGFAKGYTFALQQWQAVLGGLNALRRRGMAIILLAHAKIERFEDPATDSYDRYVPRLHKLASHVLQEWCDEVLFANYKVFTTKADAGFNRKETRGVGSGERVLYTTERPAHVAKNRLNLPDELPLDWREYAKFLPPDGGQAS